MDKHIDGDLYYIMGAVQALIEEMLPVDEDGCQDHTPEILHKLQSVQDIICKVLDLPKRPLIGPSD